MVAANEGPGMDVGNGQVTEAIQYAGRVQLKDGTVCNVIAFKHEKRIGDDEGSDKVISHLQAKALGSDDIMIIFPEDVSKWIKVSDGYIAPKKGEDVEEDQKKTIADDIQKIEDKFINILKKEEKEEEEPLLTPIVEGSSDSDVIARSVEIFRPEDNLSTFQPLESILDHIKMRVASEVEKKQPSSSGTFSKFDPHYGGRADKIIKSIDRGNHEVLPTAKIDDLIVSLLVLRTVGQ